MTKLELLRQLDQEDEADAFDVASALEVTVPAASMALLRLFRQGLVARFLDAESGLYWYSLTEKGEARLDYLDNVDDFDE